MQKDHFDSKRLSILDVCVVDVYVLGICTNNNNLEF